MYALTASLYFLQALAAPSFRHDSYSLHEERSLDPAWAKRSRADGDLIVPVRIGLTQSNLDVAPDLLLEVSDPQSAQYGKYYTHDEVISLFAPSEETVGHVRTWLDDAAPGQFNVSMSANQQWLQFDAKIHQLETLMKAEFYLHEHLPSGQLHPACDSYYIPLSLKDHIDYMTPGIKLPDIRGISRKAKKRAVDKSGSHINWRLPITSQSLPADFENVKPGNLSQQCAKAITPDCIRALYNFTLGTTAVPGNELGIFESLDDYYRQEDFDRFFSKYFPQIKNGTHPTPIAIDGGREYPNAAPAEVGLESQLDFGLAMPIVYPQKTWDYQDGDRYSEIAYPGIFNTFLDAIDGSYCSYCAYGQCGDLKGYDPPFPDPHKGGYKGKLQCGKYRATNVISISYGASEFYTPLSYQRRLCNEFLKLGMQGVSVVVASGDSGFASSHLALDNGCLWAKRSNYLFTESFHKTVANPDTPQSCPWVTVVGATSFPEGADINKGEETRSELFPSGAGFSNVFGRPKYQDATVSEYFKLFQPPFKGYNSVLNDSFAKNGGLYNRIGRAYPDVSANGQNILLSVANRFSLHGGTSASAPIFASILTRINEERLLANKSTIGFVNPVLYQNPGVLHDLTEKSVSGCVSISFNATKGWDPVYGLGTPNFPDMLKLFQSLP